MKKKINTLTLIILAGILLLSLTGCGALFNGDKQLTGDKLVALGDDESFDLYMKRLYYLDYGNNSNNEIYPIFTGLKSSYYLYLISLSQDGSNLNYVSNTNLTTNYRSDGFSYTKPGAFTSLPDAYMLGSKYYSFDSGFTDVSNVIMKNDIIKIVASQKSTWANAKGKKFTSSSSSCGSVKDYEPSGSTTQSSTCKYLWVKLSDDCWVCMGDVSSAQ